MTFYSTTETFKYFLQTESKTKSCTGEKCQLPLHDSILNARSGRFPFPDTAHFTLSTFEIR